VEEMGRQIEQLRQAVEGLRAELNKAQEGRREEVGVQGPSAK
jgi:hypothetical protein